MKNRENAEMSGERSLIQVPEQTGFDANLYCRFMHHPVIGYELGICQVHESYSLSRIFRISFVESASESRAFPMDFVSSDSGNTFPRGCNSAIIECNSTSTFFNLFIMLFSSTNITSHNYISGLYKSYAGQQQEIDELKKAVSRLKASG
ncbi:hypothetical protein HYY74_05110 [Candidatus Woesearchaeota archaeon]|nr:hypothetical protein [Candidatus Woesearchaeota archaeon]